MDCNSVNNKFNLKKEWKYNKIKFKILGSIDYQE